MRFWIGLRRSRDWDYWRLRGLVLGTDMNGSDQEGRGDDITAEDLRCIYTLRNLYHKLQRGGWIIEDTHSSITTSTREDNLSAKCRYQNTIHEHPVYAYEIP